MCNVLVFIYSISCAILRESCAVVSKTGFSNCGFYILINSTGQYTAIALYVYLLRDIDLIAGDVCR